MVAKDIMKTDYPSVTPDTLLSEAREIMAASGDLVLPIIDESGSPVGVLLEADLLRAVLPKYLDSVASLDFLPEGCSLTDMDLRVETMTVGDLHEDRKLHTIKEDTRLVEIAHVLVTKQIAGVAVVKDDKDDTVRGMIARRDLVEHIFEHTLCEVEYDDD